MNRRLKVAGAAVALLATASEAQATEARMEPLHAPGVEMPRKVAHSHGSRQEGHDMSKAAQKASAPGGTFYYGYLGDSDCYEPYGIYRMGLDGEKTLMWSDYYLDSKYTLSNAWMKDGRLCALVQYYLFSVIDYRYQEYDPFTGERLDDRVISLQDPVTEFMDYLPYYISAAYDPYDDMLYGYTCNPAGTGYAFFKAPGADPDATVAVKEDIPYSQVCASICYSPVDECLYGVNRDNKVVRIAPDGAQTELMSAGCNTAYAVAALTYDPDNDWYLWNACLTDRTTHLRAIDLKSNTITELAEFPNAENFMCLFVGDQSATPQSLSTPIIDKVSFPHGSTDGSITCFMPESHFLGDPLEGEVEWFSHIDGVECASGVAAVGTRVKVDFKSLTEGMHTFTFKAVQDDQYSPLATTTLYIGHDQPYAPADVTFDGKTASWSPVLRGVNGGYIDLEALTYHVFVNGSEAGTTRGTSFDINIPDDAAYASYTVYVTAENHGLESEPSKSTPPINVGKAWQLPVMLVPTREEAGACVAIDADGDTNAWGYVMMNDGTEVFCDPILHGHNCDDYLFLPPTMFDEEDAVYEFSFDVFNVSGYPDLRFSAALYSDLNPKAKVCDIIPSTVVTENEPYRISQVFTIQTQGVLYIAFHTDNDPYKYGIRIKRLEVVKKQSGNDGIPGNVTDLTATGAPEGKLKATVRFTMPETQLNGSPLPAGEMLTAVVSCVDTVEVTALPGAPLDAEVTTLQGDNEIEVSVGSSAGMGQKSTVRVYTGYDVPDGVRGLTGHVTADNRTLHCEWEAPSKGENGYFIDPGLLTYQVLLMDLYDGWVTIDELPADAREYDYTLGATDELTSVKLGIAPVSVAGRSGTINWLTDELGLPYPLPMHEDFADAQMHYAPVRIIRPSAEYTDSEFGVVDPSRIDAMFANDTDMAAYGRSTGGECKGMLMLPKFSTEGAEGSGMVMHIWNGGYSPRSIRIYGDAYGLPGWESLASVEAGQGWTEMSVNFPESMQQNPWCAIYFDISFGSTYEYFLMQDYEIKGGVSGVNGVHANAVSVTSLEGGISVQSSEDTDVTVYSHDGLLVRKTGSGQGFIPLPAGIYVVQAGNQTFKAAVR